VKQNCTICNIVKSRLKNFIIYEDDLFISFLDIKPLFFGHSLLAPKKHFRTIYDLPGTAGNALLLATQEIGNAITAAMNAQGTFIAINNNVSQSIDHLHIHLVPRNKGDGLKGFFWPRTSYQNENQMLEVQLAIKNEITKRGL
jgi:histidine triad (HIT) family protein